MSNPFGYGQTYVPSYMQGQQPAGGNDQGMYGSLGTASSGNQYQTGPAQNINVAQGMSMPSTANTNDLFQMNGIDLGATQKSVDQNFLRPIDYTIGGVAMQTSKDLFGRTTNRSFGDQSGHVDAFNYGNSPINTYTNSLGQRGPDAMPSLDTMNPLYQNYISNLNSYYDNMYGKQQETMNNMGDPRIMPNAAYRNNVQGIQNQLNPYFQPRDQAMAQARQAYVDLYNQMSKAGRFGLGG